MTLEYVPSNLIASYDRALDVRPRPLDRNDPRYAVLQTIPRKQADGKGGWVIQFANQKHQLSMTYLAGNKYLKNMMWTWFINTDDNPRDRLRLWV